MYLDFYGLHEKPFNLTPDTKFLYLSKNHQDALNNLIYGIREKEWFMVLTGDIGTGKTTLVRALLERLNEDTSSALILDPLLEGVPLLRAILEDFGMKGFPGTRKDLVDRLNRFLLEELRAGRRTVLIVDEAQHLSDQAMEQIRLLSNLETEKAKLLQIILVGQLELHQKLECSFLRPLNQRISIRYHLLPLSREDTEQYVHHRLLVAGSNRGITFSAGALKEVFKASRGIPRLINLVCERTLLSGYTKQSYFLDKKMVNKGVESLKRQGVPSSIPSGRRRVLFYGALALLLGCIFLIGPHGQDLLVRSSESAPVIGEPVPGPENSPTVSWHYSIHMSSHRDHKGALMDIEELRRKGYQASAVKVDIPGKGIWYRVISGRFGTRGEAETMLKDIKTLKGFSDARIIRLS